MNGSRTTLAGWLARMGFADAGRAERLLLRDLGVTAGELTSDPLVTAIAAAADPDLALAGLARLFGATARPAELRAALRADQDLRDRLTAVLGVSAGLADHLARHPEDAAILRDGEGRPDPAGLREEMLQAVGAKDLADPVASAAEPAAALAAAYRRQLLDLAARDLTGAATVDAVGEELADIAAAVLGAALAVARAELPPGAAPCRLAVVAMGKCGGHELNYASDIDVIFVAEPVNGEDENAALATAARLAAGLIGVCARSTPEGSIFPVDPNLRPEGRAGPLVRTLASHLAYYERWAKTWEFQALLKARPVAGDLALGEAYATALGPLVWQAARREHFVEDVQAMRRRVEQSLPARRAGRELKLGPGGLRDIEFAVQLLQLVHGRTDESLRSRATLPALAALAAGGYVGRADAEELGAAYRFLRRTEHLLQLHRLSRTHALPEDPAVLRRLGRAMRAIDDPNEPWWQPPVTEIRPDPAVEFDAEWRRHARQVRRLHEKLFYRPLLDAVARLPTDAARLTPAEARARLEALGYADPAGALHHIEALTSGVSRRAAIQRTLLPVLLGWFADAAEPDAGLLAFRQVSEALGSSPWYLRLLRDETKAAERMARVLASSRYAAGLLLRAPEAVAIFGDDAELAPRSLGALRAEMTAATQRYEDDAEAAVTAVRSVRRRELLRTAATELCWPGGSDPPQTPPAPGGTYPPRPPSGGTYPLRPPSEGTHSPGLPSGEASGLPGAPWPSARLAATGEALTSVTRASIEAALGVAITKIRDEWRRPLPTRFAVIAMGRFGGHECGYGSDADVLFIHDPIPGRPEKDASDAAHAVAAELRRLLMLPSPDPDLIVDADLRPEGRQGPLVRSLAAYRAYYRRWSAPWEAQALLRAEPAAGDPDLGARFTRMIAEFRYPLNGLDGRALREIRRIKARMEAERIPRGADRTRHLKLGPGGLSDVEWTVQLLQLQHGHALSALRTTRTGAAMDAAVQAGLVAAGDAVALMAAWELASRIRNAIVLVRGRPGDTLPTRHAELTAVARLLGYPPGDAAQALEQDYHRAARRARAVMEPLFYG
ncbi:MAG: bifunctional [glutamine synthetase] adenylyltransferase/[glutamine synthetase]-adenylyl-L-tyrosine phosphorylase [Actinobacteria bacterium]|nr:bifunctional [glutamine synthetase] adenylyltransferase/[glutamine synthetase]-adenylyl-L-tyrosine phosphorylase [Actinomycetota bacterium]